MTYKVWTPTFERSSTHPTAGISAMNPCIILVTYLYGFGAPQSVLSGSNSSIASSSFYLAWESYHPKVWLGILREEMQFEPSVPVYIYHLLVDF